ncbi:MAG: hypothetical protein H6718_20650 [Polyangiaceae bacterium]|nr:hypothetical protein [Myxococcales bacterium]MCB9587826.1 hypothetical protein [Polyangiaceae bacterium]MCB9608775.1 hypothetical protein [Polyangiaceae bacterium]
MRKLIPILALLSLAACDKGKADDSATSGSVKANTAAAPAADSDSKEVNLDPLPLKAMVPKSSMGAMDMSVADNQSVTLDVGGGASLNIQPAKEDFAATKKGYEGDTILFPFKKWVKDEANLAILEFENDGKKGYIGFQRIEVGGKAYYCKTTGMNGQPSADDAEKHLKHCADIKAK